MPAERAGAGAHADGGEPAPALGRRWNGSTLEKAESCDGRGARGSVRWPRDWSWPEEARCVWHLSDGEQEPETALSRGSLSCACGGSMRDVLQTPCGIGCTVGRGEGPCTDCSCPQRWRCVARLAASSVGRPVLARLCHAPPPDAKAALGPTLSQVHESPALRQVGHGETAQERREARRFWRTGDRSGERTGEAVSVPRERRDGERWPLLDQEPVGLTHLGASTWYKQTSDLMPAQEQNENAGTGMTYRYIKNYKGAVARCSHRTSRCRRKHCYG